MKVLCCVLIGVSCFLSSLVFAGDLLAFKDLDGIVIEGQGSLTLLPYVLEFRDALKVELNLRFIGSDAGYNSSFAYYLQSQDDTLVSGKVIRANVKDGGEESFSLLPADWSGANRLGWVVVPNGNKKNRWLKDGDAIDSFFQENDGTWEAVVSGKTLKHAGSGLLFSDFSLNLESFAQITDIPDSDGKAWDGNLNAEDIILGGDRDYNDIAVQMDASIKTASGEWIDGSKWGGQLLGSLVRKTKGKYYGETVSDKIMLGSGEICWRSENAPNSLIGLARTNFEIPPDDIKRDREVGYGIYLNDDATVAYVVESGKIKFSYDLDGAKEKNFCITRSEQVITYSYNGDVFFTSKWPVPENEPLYADIILSVDASFVEDVIGDGFIEPESGPDSDMDLMPDVWELQNGLNPSNKWDALEDADGDKVLNFQEYLDGQDPNVPQYAPVPQNYLWWLRADDFATGQTWSDLSLRGHDSVSDTSMIDLYKNTKGFSYAVFGMTDEATFGPGSEPWLTTDGSVGSETNIADFTLMVVCRPEWNGTGYQNLIDLSAPGSTNGFRIGIKDGSWLLESEGSEGVFLEDNENKVAVGQDIILVVVYHGETGMAEIWLNGERQTWAGKALIRNITGNGYIHHLENQGLTMQEEPKERLFEKLVKMLTLIGPSVAYGQELTNEEICFLLREVALWGRKLTYTEIVSLNASVLEMPDDVLYRTAMNNCLEYSGESDSDADGDGLTLFEEIIYGTDPEDPNSNIDLGIAYLNGVGWLDWWGGQDRIYTLERSADLTLADWEKELETIGKNEQITIEITPVENLYWRYRLEGALDSDGDLVPDWHEKCMGSDPNNKDTDGDGINDGAELKFGTDPKFCSKQDKDGDKIDDWYEKSYSFLSETNPNDGQLDEDGDGVSNTDEYLRKTDPRDPTSINSTVYCDSQMPDNSMSGFSKENYGCEGPKKDFQEGIKAAQSGDRILLKAGTYYLYGPISTGGKTIRIKVEGRVRFKTANP